MISLQVKRVLDIPRTSHYAEFIVLKLFLKPCNITEKNEIQYTFIARAQRSSCQAKMNRVNDHDSLLLFSVFHVLRVDILLPRIYMTCDAPENGW